MSEGLKQPDVGASRTLALRKVIDSHGEAPSGSRTLYLHRSVHTRADGVDEHVIAGVHVVFQAGHGNGLHEAFHVPRDQTIDAADPTVATRANRISCGTLEVVGELSLPECEVAIYARRVKFRDQGHINTTPLARSTERAADFDPLARKGGADGAAGRHAGGFTLYVGGTEAPSDEKVMRFVGRGGNGQAAGLGKDGASGTSMRTVSAVYRHWEWPFAKNTFTANYEASCVYTWSRWWWVVPLETGSRSSGSWPTSGEDALPPGVPGSGGDGATVVTNLDSLEKLVDNIAGSPGAMAPSVTGGRTGAPSPAMHYALTIRYDVANETAHGDQEQTGRKETTAGKSFTAKAAPDGPAASPSAATIRCPNAWVEPIQLESVLRYARDTKDAIRTLLLAAWVQDEANKAQSAANAFGSAIEETNKDTARVAQVRSGAAARAQPPAAGGHTAGARDLDVQLHGGVWSGIAG